MKKCKHDGTVRTDGLTFVDCLKCGRYMTLEEWEKDVEFKGVGPCPEGKIGK